MEPRETVEVSQASGTSIFWALVALALNTMTEPSLIGSPLRSEPGTITNFNPAFDPLRSSPVLCAADIFGEIFFLLLIVKAKLQKTISDSGTDATPDAPNTTELRPLDGGQNPEVLSDPALATTHHAQTNTDNTASAKSTLKVLAFLLGVLPQAIKLFSMRGIVGTQICATMFLAAYVVRVINLKSSSHFAASIDIEKEFEAYPVLIPILSVFILFCTLFAHFVFYIWIYYSIVVGLSNNAAAASDHSVNILSFLGTFVRALYTTFALLTVLFNLIWRHSLPLSKFYPAMFSYFLPPPSEHNYLPRPTKPAGLTHAFHLFMSSLLGCLLVSALCISSGRFLSRLADKRAAHSGGHLDGSLPTTSASADELLGASFSCR